jgi:5-methylcytosine-specific restriction endonuclease McrA
MFSSADEEKENYWRGIILRGANVATYKFALGKALLDLKVENKTIVNLDDLAKPFSKYICEHSASGKSQCTNQRSSFLDAINAFNRGLISYDQLINETKRNGFRYVLDAFHVLPGKGSVAERFYEIDGAGMKRKLILTDNLFHLFESDQFDNLKNETESRWLLVEDAWTFGTGSINQPVLYDIDTSRLYAEERTTYRRNLAFARSSLIGYQKGKCFYCAKSIYSGDEISCDVDHFLPFALRYKEDMLKFDLNGVWNLVLACSDCNSDKSDSVPEKKYLERLKTRNNYLISSHHPLSNTLLNQTSSDEKERNSILEKLHSYAYAHQMIYWKPSFEFVFNL